MATAEIIGKALASHDFFAGLKPEHLAELAACAQLKPFEANQMMANEGDRSNEFFAILKGTVAIEIHEPGHGSVAVQTLQEGDIAGWSWLFPPHQWVFDVRALSAVEAISFDARCLRSKCDENVELGYCIMKRIAETMTQRLKATRLRLLDSYGSSERIDVARTGSSP